MNTHLLHAWKRPFGGECLQAEIVVLRLDLLAQHGGVHLAEISEGRKLRPQLPHEMAHEQQRIRLQLGDTQGANCAHAQGQRKTEGEHHEGQTHKEGVRNKERESERQREGRRKGG